MKFAGKHIAVTGGSGEIGFCIAKEFLSQGGRVTIFDLKKSGEVAALLSKGNLNFREVDVTDPKSIEKSLEGVENIDVAVVNAGVHRGARFLDLQPKDWQLMLDVNTSGVFYFSQAIAKLMVKRGQGGNLVITGSWVQDVPQVDNTGYCASKAAVAMLARCMALELAEYDIRVNVVAPGIVNAGMARRQLQIDPVFAATATNGIPLGKLQSAEQIADAVTFLASDLTAAVTGTTLLVDGGLSLFKR